jgi:hypothetical protein
MSTAPARPESLVAGMKPQHDVQVIAVASFPADLGQWHQDEHPYLKAVRAGPLRPGAPSSRRPNRWPRPEPYLRVPLAGTLNLRDVAVWRAVALRSSIAFMIAGLPAGPPGRRRARRPGPGRPRLPRRAPAGTPGSGGGIAAGPCTGADATGVAGQWDDANSHITFNDTFADGEILFTHFFDGYVSQEEEEGPGGYIMGLAGTYHDFRINVAGGAVLFTEDSGGWCASRPAIPI